MTDEQRFLRIYHGEDYRTISCECGVEFVLLMVMRGGEEAHADWLMQQESCYFCPYCGLASREEDR